MSTIVVVGGQWGDEGKGRIIDLLAQNAHVVARFSAGNNAGHTVVNELGEFKLHLVPAGIFHGKKKCLIGNGVAIDPTVLLAEMEELEQRGIRLDGHLFISSRAHVIMPYHRLIDKLDEELRGKSAIGTTGRGVGPCFVDKVARVGIRMVDLVDPDALHAALSFALPYKNAFLSKLYGAEPLELNEVHEQYSEYGRRLSPFVADTSAIVHEALERSENVLLEGAQGALLDLDAGTYGYVTSSVPSPLSGGATVGIGIGPTQIDSAVGVFKAYCTRVGNGPFPTEAVGSDGDALREEGSEYGTTTGRPRRCGWFDAVAARYSARLNGLGAIAITRLDVLDVFPTINICTAYRLDGAIIKEFPSSSAQIERAEPVYEKLPGWQCQTSAIRTFDALPENARSYIGRLEGLIGAPVHLVSVGPERDQAIKLRPIFQS